MIPTTTAKISVNTTIENSHNPTIACVPGASGANDVMLLIMEPVIILLVFIKQSFEDRRVHNRNNPAPRA